MISKKAQVAWTITWAVAFVLIFLLMVVFFIGVSFLSKRSFDKNEISLEKIENLDSQRELMKILNVPIIMNGEKMNVKDAIVLWFSDKNEYKDILKEELGRTLTEFEYEYIDSQTNNLRKRGWRIFISLDGKELLDAFSEDFNSGKCVGTPCRNLAEISLPVSETEIVQVVIQGSQGAKENE